MAEKRIRPTAVQWALRLAWMGFLSYILWTITPWPWPVLAAWVVVLGLVTAVTMARSGVTVSADGLRWAGRPGGQLGWADVATISVRGERSHAWVVVMDQSGRQSTLNAPTTGLLNWDPNFDTKVEFLQRALDEGRRLQSGSATG